MTLFVSRITVAQAATLINAITTFTQFTVSASLVVLLIYWMPKTNSALIWTSVSRSLHASIWPTLLRADSGSRKSSGVAVTTISFLTIASIVLVPISGIILPSGLRQGPLLPNAQPQHFPAKYVPDTSPLALATTPNRQDFQYGRICAGIDVAPEACPGKADVNSTSYPPFLIDIFNSTPHGPFAMQYRRFFSSSAYQNISTGLLGTAETLVLRDGAFMVEGLVVDMSVGHPGIGFLNQTLPNLTEGGTWSQDVLWLEPITSCVDTNITVNYNLTDGPQLGPDTSFHLTDHGGFYALTRDNQSIGGIGQNIDLHQRAHMSAVMTNLLAMSIFNATRESSFEGKQYEPMHTRIYGNQLGKITPIPLSYIIHLNRSMDPETYCRGLPGDGEESSAGVMIVQVSCSAYLGPPLRTDGGDIHTFNAGSQWSQRIHSCASTTRASMQTITFSTNRSTDIKDLSITRQPSKANSVLWAVENTNVSVRKIDLLWGQVADKYENDSSIWTIRSATFYPPLGKSGLTSLPNLPYGHPIAAHGIAWGQVYNPDPELSHLVDYAGSSDYAIQSKFKSFIDDDPVHGYAHIRNAIWTDIMANNVIGTPTSTTLLVSLIHPSIEYNFKFAIPGFILLLIWAPIFIASLFFLVNRQVSFSYMRKVLNHTSVGRVVTGTSMLRVKSRGTGEGSAMPELKVSPYIPSNDGTRVDSNGDEHLPDHRREKSDCAKTLGNTPVTLCLERKDSVDSQSPSKT